MNFLTLKSVSPVFVLFFFFKFILSFSVYLKISAKFCYFYWTTSWIVTQEYNLTSHVAPIEPNIRSVSFSLRIQIKTILVQWCMVKIFRGGRGGEWGWGSSERCLKWGGGGSFQKHLKKGGG